MMRCESNGNGRLPRTGRVKFAASILSSTQRKASAARRSDTILPVQIRRAELYAQGKTTADVERDIAEGLGAGTHRLPGRPAITSMMSAAQQLVNGEGAAVLGRYNRGGLAYSCGVPAISPSEAGYRKSAFLPTIEKRRDLVVYPDRQAPALRAIC